jgi:hypothetical protein
MQADPATTASELVALYRTTRMIRRFEERVTAATIADQYVELSLLMVAKTLRPANFTSGDRTRETTI